MQSPFVIARFVSFALLVNLNLLILVFASWNANATVASGLSVSSTTIFLLFNSCTLFFFVVLGLAELVVPQAKTSRVLFECSWSAILSLFQTGTAISITVNGSAICRQTTNWDLCASSSLLLPTAWLSSILILTQFFVLFITTMSHIRVYPDIWTETVYSVNWFNHHDFTLFFEKRDKMSDSSIDMWSRYMDDIEASRSRIKLSDDCEKAPWAQATKIRRGVDSPFKTQDALPSARSSRTTEPTLFPVAPLKIQSRSTAGSRFIEKFRESKVLSRSETPAQYGTHFENRVQPFPPRVDNHDLPIPLPRLSEWIRADAIRGINVHTIPHSP